MEPMDSLTDEALLALEGRGIAPELAVALGVVSARADHGDRREWIGFRHDTGGDAYHWSFRTVTGTKDFRQSKGTERRLWNNQVIRDRSLEHLPLIITEGHIDALSIIGATNHVRVVSVPDGAPNQSSAPGEAKTKYAYLEGCGLEQVREIILATDSDNPGKALLQDLAIRLGRSRCRWVDYGRDCKDANDLLLKYGPDALQAAVNGARWLQIGGIYTLAELPPEPDLEPIVVGIAGLDDIWHPARSCTTVVTGIPGHGKTTLITDVLCHLASPPHNLVVAIASFEDRMRATLVPRLQRWYVRGDPNSVSRQLLDEANRWIADHFVFIWPQRDDDPTVDWFMERASAAVVRYNASVVVLDPWNAMDHTWRSSDVSPTEYIGVMLGRMMRHAHAHRYALVIIAHPAKLGSKTDSKLPMPNGYHISDSANFANKPDCGITIYRDDDDTIQIGCWKCRYEGILGKPQARTFRFNRINQRYQQVPDKVPDDAFSKGKRR